MGIVSCDHCSSHWHFDCVEPPLHGAPSAYKKWMCPLHADDVTVSLNNVQYKSLTIMQPHIRQARDPEIVETSLSRGFKNSGDIDIHIDDEGDPDESGSESESDMDDPAQWAPALADLPRVRYKLPSRGIILDFLDTCRQARDKQGDLDFVSDIVPTEQKYSSLETLIDIALTESHGVGTPLRSRDEEERLQIMAIQALMKAKGKEKLLQFLQD